VLIWTAEDGAEAARFRELLKSGGGGGSGCSARTVVDGLRGAELEHYSSTGRKFGDDEKFYRMGFESALHARSRCKEYDQV